jgi:hypothetical protein
MDHLASIVEGEWKAGIGGGDWGVGSGSIDMGMEAYSEKTYER